MARVGGIVLAAGAGTRMGRPKASIVLDSRRLLDRAVAVLRQGGCDPILAVVRSGVPVDGAVPIVNPDPARGMRSSLELGVRSAPTVDALAVMLVDTPGVGAQAVSAVVDAWRPGRICVAAYTGRRGHPTVMSPALWLDALEVAGPDEGARALLATRPYLVDEIDAPGDPTDIDTPQDLSRWSGER